MARRTLTALPRWRTEHFSPLRTCGTWESGFAQLRKVRPEIRAELTGAAGRHSSRASFATARSMVRVPERSPCQAEKPGAKCLLGGGRLAHSWSDQTLQFETKTLSESWNLID